MNCKKKYISPVCVELCKVYTHMLLYYIIIFLRAIKKMVSIIEPVHVFSNFYNNVLVLMFVLTVTWFLFIPHFHVTLNGTV